MTRMAGGQKTVISWQDAPDDLFFRATPTAKKVNVTNLGVWKNKHKIYLFNSFIFKLDEKTDDS